MTMDWCPGIREACNYWRDATMLHHTFLALETSLQNESDVVIDASKGLVECVCQIIVDELDNPRSPLKPKKSDVPVTEWVSAAIRVLRLGDVRHRKFADFIKDRKSTRLNSSHVKISYAVFCLKKKKKN